MTGLAINPMPEEPVCEWLAFHESFPIVPGWKWQEDTWQSWTRKLNQWQIPHCRDTYGNILLGARTREEFFNRMRRQEIRLILQSHLDHPGAILLKKTHHDARGNRYVAVRRGGLAGTLKGFSFMARKGNGQLLNTYVIDEETAGYHEKLLSFKTQDELPERVYLHGPNGAEDFDLENHFCGWAMDNHVGCACVVSHFAQYKPADVFGVLTLDEEIGALGLKSLFSEAEKFDAPLSLWPLVLTLEVTPEYKDLGLTVGNGARLRCADGLSNLDENFAKWAREKFSHAPLRLTRGSCEAGFVAKWGGKAGCLVIPCKHYHNGTTLGEWRAEVVLKDDVAALRNMMETCAKDWNDAQRRQDGTTTGQNFFCNPSITMNNHVSRIGQRVTHDTNYVDCLNSVLPVWNALHKEFGLNVVRFSQEMWPYWQKQILCSELRAGKIQTLAAPACKKVLHWLGMDNNQENTVPIHIFVGANFNASNIAHGVAFSTDKLREDDLERVIVHELAHRFLQPQLDHKNLRPLWKTFLHEGFACLATMEILNLSLAQALCLPAQTVQKYSENKVFLKTLLTKWADGDLFAVVWKRHEVVTKANPPHPYQVGGNSDWPKYGYFLAIAFLQEAMKLSKMKGARILPAITEDKFTQWVKKENI